MEPTKVDTVKGPKGKAKILEITRPRLNDLAAIDKDSWSKYLVPVLEYQVCFGAKKRDARTLEEAYTLARNLSGSRW